MPAVSIVLAAGYPEDEDYGDEFIYTGSGGYTDKSTVQISDQELTRQNMSLARACAAPINAEADAEAIDWRKSSLICVCRSYKVAKRHPEFGPKMGRGHSGPYVWRFWFHRDDPEPSPWTSEGQLRTKELGPMICDHDGADADGRCHTLRKSTQSLVRIQPNALLRELIRLDAANDRIWTGILNGAYYGELEFLEEVTKNMFVCAVCQELVQMPVTTPCGHNACAKCLCSLLCHSTECPVCCTGIKEMSDKDRTMYSVNQNLVSVLMALNPSYGQGWATKPAITRVQRARRTGLPIMN
ncbi:hypothetical protein EC988_006879 [Linderina pennispora]|nr:hypothetical protein EC988_006879 [Linderina pennispora]